MLIAQISDTHIKTDGRLAYGVVDTAAMLQQCVHHLMNVGPRPDVVLVTGDLVDFGKPAEYELLKRLLAPIDVPLFMLMGNHDERSALRQAFSGPGFEHLDAPGEFVQYAVDLGGLRLVALDTVVAGQGGGRMCEARLTWLEQQLGQDSAPTIVAMHHPPFETGIAHMDIQGLDGREAFTEVIARHPHVERVLCGHLHRSIQCRVAHTVAQTCPGPAHQVALDLRADGPDCFIMEPPGYLLHWWNGRTLVTHQCTVGDFAGPYRFREGGRLID
jgi:3',5'-cyclic AMP phosphodiesterase CpdA